MKFASLRDIYLRDLRHLKARKPSAFINLLLLAALSTTDVDAIQDISLEFLKSKHNYDFTKGSLNTWGYHIILKHRYPRETHGFVRPPKGIPLPVIPYESCLDSFGTPMSTIKLELEEYLSLLTHKERELLMDKYIIGLTLEEMTKKYKVSTQYICRVINKLLKFLHKFCKSDPTNIRGLDPDIKICPKNRHIANNIFKEDKESINDTYNGSPRLHKK